MEGWGKEPLAGMSRRTRGSLKLNTDCIGAVGAVVMSGINHIKEYLGRASSEGLL